VGAADWHLVRRGVSNPKPHHAGPPLPFLCIDQANRNWGGGATGEEAAKLDYSSAPATANGGGGGYPTAAGTSRMEDDEEDAPWSDEEEEEEAAGPAAAANGNGAPKAKGVLGSFMSSLALRWALVGVGLVWSSRGVGSVEVRDGWQSIGKEVQRRTRTMQIRHATAQSTPQQGCWQQRSDARGPAAGA